MRWGKQVKAVGLEWRIVRRRRLNFLHARWAGVLKIHHDRFYTRYLDAWEGNEKEMGG